MKYGCLHKLLCVRHDCMGTETGENDLITTMKDNAKEIVLEMRIIQEKKMI